MDSQIKQKKCVMIVAGEASGDHHGAKLVRAMQKKEKNLFFCGIGGLALKDAGVRIIIDASRLCVVGLTEVFSKIPIILRGLAIAKGLLKSLRPDLLILIDFPDFNLQIAAAAKKLDIPVLYYISPQIWAWREGRVEKIAKLVDHMAVILPFEEEFYKKHDVEVSFVGHPLLDNEYCKKITGSNKADDLTVIGILPGSRNSEVMRHLPVMLDAAEMLSERIKNLKVIISITDTVDKKLAGRVIKKHQGKTDYEMSSESIGKILEECTIVVAASGTVTLEAAIYGIPMVIVYKMSNISYWLGRALIRVKNIGLVNLIAGRTIVPELLQGEASAENIADTAFNMLKDPDKLEEIRKELLCIRELLGGPGASKRVANIALKIIGFEYQ